jgi:hypothetical protein
MKAKISRRVYNKAARMSPVYGGDDGALGFSLNFWLSIYSPPPPIGPRQPSQSACQYQRTCEQWLEDWRRISGYALEGENVTAQGRREGDPLDSVACRPVAK